MDTETIDRFYLELSQFTSAKTKRELELEQAIIDICESKSWEEQMIMSECARAKVENREPETWVKSREEFRELMGDTPKTDAVAQDSWSPDAECVDSDFAREQERRIRFLEAENISLKKKLQIYEYEF